MQRVSAGFVCQDPVTRKLPHDSSWNVRSRTSFRPQVDLDYYEFCAIYCFSCNIASNVEIMLLKFRFYLKCVFLYSDTILITEL